MNDDIALDVVFAPGLVLSSLQAGIDAKDWLPVRITGHHDDPAAADCKLVMYDQGVPTPLTPEQAILRCRSAFVVTEIQPIT